MEVMVFGNRMSYKMVENNGSELCNENKFTLPKHKSAIVSAIKMSARVMLFNMNLDVVNG